MKKIIRLIPVLFFYFLTISASSGQKEYTAYVFIAEQCPISIYMAQPLSQVYEAFGEEVNFSAVFPMKNSTVASAQNFLEQHGLDQFAIKLDEDQAFAKLVGASITPEVVVLDLEGTIVYRGRISDAYRAPGKMKHGTRKNDLSQVLQALINGGNPPQPWASAVGCYITFH